MINIVSVLNFLFIWNSANTFYRRQTHFVKNLLRINLESGLFSVAVYTPNSDPISDVHWLVRRKIGSAVRGCAKLVDIRTCIENVRLVTSLVYCAIYAQLLVLRALGGASYRTGIIPVVVRMAAPPATTSSASMDPCRSVGDGGGGRVPTLFIYACVDYPGWQRM